MANTENESLISYLKSQHSDFRHFQSSIIGFHHTNINNNKNINYNSNMNDRQNTKLPRDIEVVEALYIICFYTLRLTPVTMGSEEPETMACS